MNMSPVRLKHLFKTNVEPNDETSCDCAEFCQEDHGTSGHMDWEYHGGRTGSGQSDRKCRCDWTFAKIQQDLITTTSRAPNVARGRLNSASSV